MVAAPALALWAAYRGAPHTDEGPDGNAVSTTDVRGGDSSTYERTGSDGAVRPRQAGHGRTSDGAPGADLADDGNDDPSAATDAPLSLPSAAASGATTPSPGPGWITVAAQPEGDSTAITLSAAGGSPVHWTASTGAGWLQLSATSGVLRPGESVTITVVVDHSAEPAGPWRARVAIDPGGSVITIEGTGHRPTPSGSPTPSPSPTAARPTPSPS